MRTVSIPLSQGKYAVIDEQDADLVSGYRWHFTRLRPLPSGVVYGYAATTINDRRVYLHRLILGAQEGQIVDHINGDTLDCRRGNLRFATASQNIANQRRNCRNTSGFRGVYWSKSHGKWRARLKTGGKNRSLGYFKTREGAARAYDEEARNVWGEFARLNFPTDDAL